MELYYNIITYVSLNILNYINIISYICKLNYTPKYFINYLTTCDIKAFQYIIKELFKQNSFKHITNILYDFINNGGLYNHQSKRIIYIIKQPRNKAFLNTIKCKVCYDMYNPSVDFHNIECPYMWWHKIFTNMGNTYDMKYLPMFIMISMKYFKIFPMIPFNICEEDKYFYYLISLIFFPYYMTENNKERLYKIFI